MAEKFDLFGNPVRDGHGEKGRPPFEVTQRIRNKVKLLMACGWPDARIAKAIRCTMPTFRKHFFSERKDRDVQDDQLKAELLLVAAEKAMTGNPSAMRLFDAMIERSDRMEATRKIAQGDDRVAAQAGASVKQPITGPAGKKAAKKADAAELIRGNADLFGAQSTKH